MPADPEGSFARCTLPVVRFPDESCVMESSNIVKKLEAMVPNPTLRTDIMLQQQAQNIIDQMIFPMAPYVFRRVHDRLVTEGEMQWIRTDREKRACQMLGRDRISQQERGGAALSSGMCQLSDFLAIHKQDGGAFVLGSEPWKVVVLLRGAGPCFIE